MAEFIATTERLVLRYEVEGDRAVWLEHMNTPQVTEHIGGPQPPEAVAEAFERMAIAHAEADYAFALVALKRDGTLIGKCGLATIPTPTAPAELRGKVQVGWTLRADFWGRGYAREAAEAALELAFERYALSVLYAQTSERNAASWRLIERLGMTRRSELDYFDPDYPPEENPTKVYSLDRAAWMARGA
jgi:RimJ/RimL family protein N-acetyltransferase